MPTIDALALVTNQGKARIAEMLATGKSFVVDTFVVGANGHDPIDPTLAITPDAARTGCYCGGPSGAITTAGGCSFSGSINSVTFAPGGTCPAFECVVSPGDATGAVSSICLLGTIVYSPAVVDAEIGTQFLFAIANFPLKYKIPSDNFVYDVFIQI